MGCHTPCVAFRAWVRGRLDELGKAGRDATCGRSMSSQRWWMVFDPELMGPRDAMDLVAVFSRIEHLASAGVALAARRVAGTDLWRRGVASLAGALVGAT